MKLPAGNRSELFWLVFFLLLLVAVAGCALKLLPTTQGKYAAEVL